MGQINPVLLGRVLRTVGTDWRGLRFGLVQREVVSGLGSDFGGGAVRGKGEERGGAPARNESMAVRNFSHSADCCGAPIG